jgi:pimeloyl-ACP methyl ester carboxylesterase
MTIDQPDNSSRRHFLKASSSLGLAIAFNPGLIGEAIAASSDESDAKAIVPFTLKIPESALIDLRRRLEATRWPERETVADWSQGVPLARIQALVEYWLTKYDWRRCEAMLNRFGQFKTQIDGLRFHFLHVRSRHANALPLILTHGWPGSVIEFHKVIGPLTEPTAHGGKAEDAFHVVVPSLPGYGFSDRPTQTGWNSVKTAAAWTQLMPRLGYKRYVAQGGDWGASVTTELAHLRPPELAGIHLNMLFVLPRVLPKELSEEEQAALAALDNFGKEGFGYAKQQATRPQTLGYALTDSPVGQAAWIYEKFAEWTDSNGNPETVLSMDEMLDDIMLYWLPGTAASAARMYWENSKIDFTATAVIDLPVGCSIFPKEIYRAPRSWAQLVYRNLIHWNELDRGGHFAAFEQPELFVNELRACFRKLR